MNSYASQNCKETIAVLEKCANINDIGESYYRLALFGLKQFRSLDINEKHANELGKSLIVSVLRGMRYGSKNARLQFPRLLHLPNIRTSEMTEVFIQEVCTIAH